MAMDMLKENASRQAFCTLLLDLAQSQTLLENPKERVDFYKRLEALYYAPTEAEAFRHFYSDVFAVLTQIHNGESSGSIEILGQNLDMLRKNYRAIKTDDQGKLIDVSEKLKKLYDHVNLDIARLTYADFTNQQMVRQDNIRNINASVTMLEEKLSQSQGDVDLLKEKLANTQKEYVTILGIFAAVVLAFTGGLVFSASVLDNVQQSSVYRLILITLVIGLVLTNILFVLFHYIDTLVHDGRSQITRPMRLVNIILLCLIALLILAWVFGLVEKRDAMYDAPFPPEGAKLVIEGTFD